MSVPQNQQRPALLDLKATGDFLGVPLHSIRRWHLRGNAPTGFPEPVRFGPRIAYRTAELEHWALGRAAPAIEAQGHTAAPPPSPATRGRGRPRKHPLPKTGGEA